jgi:hypothetical protein
VVDLRFGPTVSTPVPGREGEGYREMRSAQPLGEIKDPFDSNVSFAYPPCLDVRRTGPKMILKHQPAKVLVLFGLRGSTPYE